MYVDSPLATNVTEIFRLHPECYDEEILEYINTDPDGNAFGWPRLRYVRTADESKALNESKQTCVIIAASGMCEAGRVLHHLKHHIGDPRATVLFVGYQAENTLGRKILDGEPLVRILAMSMKSRRASKRLTAIARTRTKKNCWRSSARSRNSLARCLSSTASRTRPTAMATGLRGLGIQNVTIPERGQTFEI